MVLTCRPTESFELEDLDRFDLVVALDSGVLADIRGRVAEEYPTGPDREYYTEVRGGRITSSVYGTLQQEAMNLSQAGRLEAYGNPLFWGTACAPAPIAIKVTGSGWGRGRVAEEDPTGPDREYYTEVRGDGLLAAYMVLCSRKP